MFAKVQKQGEDHNANLVLYDVVDQHLIGPFVFPIQAGSRKRTDILNGFMFPVLFLHFYSFSFHLLKIPDPIAIFVFYAQNNVELYCKGADKFVKKWTHRPDGGPKKNSNLCSNMLPSGIWKTTSLSQSVSSHKAFYTISLEIST